MGGYGSSRWGFERTKATTSSAPYLDVRHLQRHGYLRPDANYFLGWAGKRIGLRVDNAGLWLEELDTGRVHRARLTSTRCNYGGARPWLMCPRCGCRAARLYLRRELRCRDCHGLAYPSTRRDSIGRLQAKARALRQQLGGGDVAIPPRPKGMWHTTYERLVRELVEVETALWSQLGARVDRLYCRTLANLEAIGRH